MAKHQVRICTECRTTLPEHAGVCPNCGSHEWSAYVPTPEEIIASREAIKAAWTRSQEADHALEGRVPCSIPHARIGAYRNGQISFLNMKEA